jgi:hypothetical protein
MRWPVTFKYVNEPAGEVNTYPMTPLPAGTGVYDSTGERVATLGPPRPELDGSWSNAILPLTADPGASAPADDHDQQT